MALTVYSLNRLPPHQHRRNTNATATILTAMTSFLQYTNVINEQKLFMSKRAACHSIRTQEKTREFLISFVHFVGSHTTQKTNGDY